ncbi:MAG: PAS domain S-box protein [Smithella sp.]
MTNESKEKKELLLHIEDLQIRLDEAEETLQAIRRGDVDALVVRGEHGDQIFTLEGEDYTYRVLIEKMNEGAGKLNAEGIILYANSKLAQMLSIPLEQLIGSPMKNYIHPDHMETYETLFTKGFIDSSAGEILLKTGEKSFVPARFSTSRIYTNRQGELSIIITDLTAFKEQDAALQESEQRLADIIDFLPDAIFAIDLSGSVIAWNRAMEELTGVKRKDILGKDNYEYAMTFYGKKIPALIDQALGYVAVDEKNFDFVRREGDILIAQGDINLKGKTLTLWRKIAPLRDSHGNIVGAIESFHDISELKKMEKTLQKAYDELEIRVKERTSQLEAVNSELESFSYSVSHDLRAPLRAIDGFSRMILKRHGANFDEDTQNKFNVIRHNTETMGQLIDGLLELSRLGRKALVMSTIDMDNIIKEVWEEIQVINQNRKMSLVIKPPPQAFGDRQLMRQVYSNLLANAVKFTKNKDVAQIETGGFTDREKGSVYYVKDNGAGFDMAYYDKLFGVFQRLHRTEEFEGTGIGLATVQRIINKHGGHVWAEGKVDEGATFYFSLPLQKNK